MDRLTEATYNPAAEDCSICTGHGIPRTVRRASDDHMLRHSRADRMWHAFSAVLPYLPTERRLGELRRVALAINEGQPLSARSGVHPIPQVLAEVAGRID